MAVVTGKSEGGMLAKEICDAFGLKHVRRLDFHMAHNEIFTVTAEFYPEIDGVRQAVPILKKFELVPIKDEYGTDGEKVSPPSTFMNECDLK